ncbi:Imm26 family immunity protein [Microbacterium keratanolyticum]
MSIAPRASADCLDKDENVFPKEDSEFRMNLQVLAPSRKRQRAGDVFVMQVLDLGYLFGRVISPSAAWTTGRAVNLIQVYRGLHASKDAEFDGSPSNLLIPPRFTNSLPWSRGYFETLRNEPLDERVLLPEYRFLHRPSQTYWDELGNSAPAPAASTPPVHVGVNALDSFRSIDREVSLALGIPMPEYYGDEPAWVMEILERYKREHPDFVEHRVEGS